MKRKRSIIVLLLFVALIMVNPIRAKASEEDAVRKQVETMCKGLKSHNYSKINKVVKDKSTYFKMQPYDKIIGKTYLKEMAKYIDYSIDSILVVGNTAYVDVKFHYCDSSNYYYIVNRQLTVEHKNIKKNFAKTLKSIRKTHKESIKTSKKYIYMINNVSKSCSFTMIKSNGKWVITKESEVFDVFDVYTSGYGILFLVGGNDFKNYWEKEMKKVLGDW